MQKIVTQTTLQQLITRGDTVAMHAIGRALVHLLKRQTEYEQSANITRDYNLRGFTPGDAHSGCITAKYYLKHKKLLDWQIENWTKRNKKGIARLAKYWRQLNEEANKKAVA